jgi:acyl-CoA thioester hydrolase
MLEAPTDPTRFRLPVRVYWEDTDAGGVVFYANYLKFFERARTEWLRALGFEQQRLREASGVIFVVSETSVRYRAPARLDDQIEITARLLECRGATMLFRQQALRGAEVLAEGDIRVGCVGAEDFRPRRIPAPLLKAIS